MKGRRNPHYKGMLADDYRILSHQRKYAQMQTQKEHVKRAVKRVESSNENILQWYKHIVEHTKKVGKHIDLMKKKAKEDVLDRIENAYIYGMMIAVKESSFPPDVGQLKTVRDQVYVFNDPDFHRHEHIDLTFVPHPNKHARCYYCNETLVTTSMKDVCVHQCANSSSKKGGQFEWATNGLTNFAHIKCIPK